MAIAIPLIGGVREAANNAKCRSNLKQLHTAIIAYATGNKERLPNIAGSNNLHILINSGYVDENTKLGDCPGSPDKEQGLSNSAYEGGDLIDGRKLSHSNLGSNSIVLEDKASTYHKAGKNAIRMDGSFRQKIELTLAQKRELLTTDQREKLDADLLIAARDGDLEAVKRLIGQGADVTTTDNSGRTPLNIVMLPLSGDFSETILFLLSIEEVVQETLNRPDDGDYPPLYNLLEGISFYDEDNDPNIDAMFDMAEALIHAGADVTIIAIDETALSLAEYLTDYARGPDLIDLIYSELE